MILLILLIIRKKAKKEVCLLSALSCDLSFLSFVDESPFIIHYYSCWEEDQFFFIQLEYAFYGSTSKYREKVASIGVVEYRMILRNQILVC